MTNGSKLMNAGVHIKYGLEGLVFDEPYSHKCPMFNAKQCAIVLLRCSYHIGNNCNPGEDKLGFYLF